MLKLFSSYLFFSVMNAGVSFFISVYLARTLTLHDFGVVGLFLAVLYFAIPMAHFNTVGLVSINKVQLGKSDFQVFANNYFTFILILFAFYVFLSLVAAPFLPGYEFFIYFFPGLIFVMALAGFQDAVLIQDHKSKTFGLFIFLTRISILGISYFLIEYHTYHWNAYMWALLIAELLVLFIRLLYNYDNLRKYKFSFSNVEMLKLVTFGAPLLIGLLAGWGLNQADRFIVLEYFSLEQVAFYTVAYSLGVVINTINQAMTNTIVPTIYAALKKGEAEPIIKKYILLYTAIISVIVLIFCLSASYFIPYFYDERYSKSIDVTILIAIAFGFNGIYRITGLVIAYYKMNVLQTKLMLLSMLLNIGLSIALIQSFGILAPAIGTIVAYIFLAISSLYCGNKVLKGKK